MGELKLAEGKIEWPGGDPKPLEMSLPKHLRTVMVSDPPFVYSWPTNDARNCADLEVVEVDGIQVV